MNNRIDVEKRKNIFRNRHIVKCVSEAILFCGRQGIALRGENGVLNENNSGNTGNLLAVLQMIPDHDDILKQHCWRVGYCLIDSDNIQLTSRKITYNNMSPLIGSLTLLDRISY